MKKRIFIVLTALLVMASGGSTSSRGKKAARLESPPPKMETEAEKNLYKGAGVSIAVTSPQLREAAKTDAWIPQFMQDSLTGNFARYSKMTVLDRSNENLIKAEQELSETGFYSDEGAVQIGHLTNAQFVVTGSIQKIAGSYQLNFRVNDVTTNEIKASAIARYSLHEIENGLALNEVTQNLLEGLGIGLSAAEKDALSKVNTVESKSAQSLAKGAAAELSGDIISALIFYSETGGAQQKEASSRAHTLLAGEFDASSVQNRVAYYQAQIDRWNRIFEQLESYMNNNAVFIVYDFSTLSDTINMQKNIVNFTVAPGIKAVPNRVAMQVYATVLNEWRTLFNDRENDVWTRTVKEPYFGENTSRPNGQCCYNLDYIYQVSVGLYNGDGDILGKQTVPVEFSLRPFSYDRHQLSEITVKSQKKYFQEAEYKKAYFSNIKLDDVIGNMTIKPLSAKTDIFTKDSKGYRTKKESKAPTQIFSTGEWDLKMSSLIN